ncbi:MAG: response regulator [Bacteroidales bacterium]
MPEPIPNIKFPAGKTILLAEDDPFNALLIKTQCKRHNIGITIANNGQKAYDMALETHFDLILTDINMPVLSGIDLVKKIRSTPRLASMPIIALTASKTVDDTKNMQQAGVSSILYKPFTETELIGMLILFLQ